MKSSIMRTGTAIEEPGKRLLKAGLLEVTLDAGALRWVRWNGVEILRGISFLVRTPGWGTPSPLITDLQIEEEVHGFHVRYAAYFGENGKGVLATISFKADADGHLEATAEIQADTAFSTNRTGFVILHPLLGFAGTEVEVEHASSGSRNLTIPLEISPGQPVMDIKAIAHRPRKGLRIATRFEGDIFEMEDHRNWSDASFKTYSRPIGLPYPYLLEPGAPVTQSVTVTITEGGEGKVEDAISVPDVESQILPEYALPLDRLDDAREALRFVNHLADLKPARLLLRHDIARGDTTDAAPDLAELLRLTGATLEVQLVLGGDDYADADRVVKKLAQDFNEAGIVVAAIAAFAKIDEQSFQPGEARPPHLADEELARLLATVFPDSRRGGGSPAFFTEFNRKRPNPSLADFLTFATTPVVHAADDASVFETLQALPHILHSAKALSKGRPLAIGPVGIGARLNPYGPAPFDNKPDDRTGMAARDPRQRGLFAAAWHVGYLSRIAPWGIERIAFGAPTGPFGLVVSRQAFERDGWDDLPEGAVYPLYHVARWISDTRGARLVEAWTKDDLSYLAWKRNGHIEALFANLSLDPIVVDVKGKGAAGSLLDQDSAERAALEPKAFSILQPLQGSVRAGGYGVLYVEYGAAP